MINQCRMGKGLHPCPSIQRVTNDGHVVPPLPILREELNFYIKAIDEQLRSETGLPTIGIFLCKNKDNLVAEYAFSDIQKPIGVLEYQLTQSLPKDPQRRMGKGLYPCPSVQRGGEL